MKMLSIAAWSLLVLAYSFLMLITVSGWGQHLLSLSAGDWFPLKAGDNLHMLSSAYQRSNVIENARRLEVKDDISEVSLVLILESEPEISIYLNSSGDIVATRLGIASVLWVFNPSDVARTVMILGIGLFLLGRPKSPPLSLIRGLGAFVLSFMLLDLSGMVLVYYPLYVWALASGLGLFLLAIIFGLVAGHLWTSGRNGSQMRSG